MIICVCNNLSDKIVKEYKKDDKRLKDLVQDYGICCSGCKKCLPYFKEGFRKEK